MSHTVIIAGGDFERRLRLSNNLDLKQYNVRLCGASKEINDLARDEKIVACILLYPVSHEVVGELFNRLSISSNRDKGKIIFVSSNPAENGRARSLRYQADEFLIEPVSPRELLDIIDQAARSSVPNEDGRVLAIGDLVLNRASLTVTLRNMKLRLFPTEARVLEFLMLNPGHVYTRQGISASIWGRDGSVDERTIDVSIGRIRDALKHKVSVDPIRTIRSVGYAFNEKFGEISSVPKKGSVAKRMLRKADADGIR